MTPELLIEMVTQGNYRVKCDTTEQRRAVLEFFDEQCIRIGSVTRRQHLETPPEHDMDTRYMFLGFDDDVNCITLWTIPNGSTIEYEQIEEIVEGHTKPLDDRNDAEFAEDFALLFGERSPV